MTSKELAQIIAEHARYEAALRLLRKDLDRVRAEYEDDAAIVQYIADVLIAAGIADKEIDIISTEV